MHHEPHPLSQASLAMPNVMFTIAVQGFGETARDIYMAAATEHEEMGVAGAMGGVIRQLPGAFVRPIILASEATRHVLGGVKNQFVPDAKEESSNKWKTDYTWSNFGRGWVQLVILL